MLVNAVDVPRSAKEVLASFGGDGAREMTAELVAAGVPALVELLRELDGDAPVGEKDANGRAVMEDLEACLVSFACAHPDELIDGIDRHPRLSNRFPVLSAIGSCPSPRATPILLEALTSRSGSQRWLALTGLLDRGAPEVLPRLEKLLRDRDGLVVFAATSALLRLGSGAHLPRLIELANSKRTALGTREAAFDAIEAICGREGLPLPDISPPPRLVPVDLPEGAEPAVFMAELVKRVGCWHALPKPKSPLPAAASWSTSSRTDSCSGDAKTEPDLAAIPIQKMPPHVPLTLSAGPKLFLIVLPSNTGARVPAFDSV